ncbi:MAG: methylated-DNA--[protein]-cysteine S-methyltransferase [Chloroflexi bacterium]|nr:methylated-DNA--[protein]-cysteine S-methyltransferase [Chloroflexota bacterium]
MAGLPQGGVAYTGILCPLGMLWIAVGPRGLVRVDAFTDEVSFCYQVEREGWGIPEYRPEELGSVAGQFVDYFGGRRRRLDLAADLGRARPFQRAVLEAVLAVPYGAVRSYREIACAVDKPGATRAVGAAVATNPVSIVVPCHRIVRHDGTAGEYALRALGRCGVQYKLMLLRLEGVDLVAR